MVIKNKAKTVKRVTKFLESMEGLFSVQHFTHEIKIVHGDKDEEEGRCAAEILFDEPYQTVIIHLYPFFFELDAHDQRKCLLHELCHIFTLPSKKLLYSVLDGQHVTKAQAHKLNERETSQIENVLHALLLGKAKYARTAYQNYDK